MAQNYWIDERNRTRPSFPEPPGPTPVQREPYALSAFEKDADWLRRNPEQNPDPAIRTAPADTVMGMAPDPFMGFRSGAAKAAGKAGLFTGPKGYAAELQKGLMRQGKEAGLKPQKITSTNPYAEATKHLTREMKKEVSRAPNTKGWSPRLLERHIAREREFATKYFDKKIASWKANPRTDPGYVADVEARKHQIVENMLSDDILKLEALKARPPFHQSELMKEWVYPGAGAAAVIGSPYAVDRFREGE